MIDEYLRGLWELEESKDKSLTRAQLAETLQRSRPAVTQYLRVLASHNLVRQAHYGPLSLTEAGACRALSAVRAERICRCHLFTVLSVPWHRVLKEASVMAMALSSDVVETMAALASSPKLDPYGNRIPKKVDDLRPGDGEPLAALPTAHLLQVSRIGRAPEHLLFELERKNILPGTHITLEKHADGQSSLTLEPDDNVVVLSDDASEYVYAASTIQ